MKDNTSRYWPEDNLRFIGLELLDDNDYFMLTVRSYNMVQRAFHLCPGCIAVKSGLKEFFLSYKVYLLSVSFLLALTITPLLSVSFRFPIQLLYEGGMISIILSFLLSLIKQPSLFLFQHILYIQLSRK